jgi:hypothetical protein
MMCEMPVAVGVMLGLLVGVWIVVGLLACTAFVLWIAKS